MLRHFVETVNYETKEEMQQDYNAHLEKFGNSLTCTMMPVWEDANGIAEVTYEYREEQPFSRKIMMTIPQCPRNASLRYEIMIEVETTEAALDIVKNYDKYWPGMRLHYYAVAASEFGPIVANLTLVNYEIEPPQEDEEEDELCENI